MIDVPVWRRFTKTWWLNCAPVKRSPPLQANSPSGPKSGIPVLSRVLKSFLFQVEPSDPVTPIGVAVLFAGVLLLACWAPTGRAAKVDPVEALRYE